MELAAQNRSNVQAQSGRRLLVLHLMLARLCPLLHHQRQAARSCSQGRRRPRRRSFGAGVLSP
jgi:hypothetical protein